MYLPLKTILLGAAVGSAIPVAITPQQHHDATEFQHKIQDHGIIIVDPPAPGTPRWRKLVAELEKCNTSGYHTCLESGGQDCEAEMDRSGECNPDMKSFVERVGPHYHGILPESEIKLVPEDPDQLPEDDIWVPDGATVIIDDVPTASSNQVGHLGSKTLVASQIPSCLLNCLRGPAEGPDENRERVECVRRCREQGQD